MASILRESLPHTVSHSVPLSSLNNHRVDDNDNEIGYLDDRGSTTSSVLNVSSNQGYPVSNHQRFDDSNDEMDHLDRDSATSSIQDAASAYQRPEDNLTTICPQINELIMTRQNPADAQAQLEPFSLDPKKRGL
jgi:hypothetical protein